MATTVEYVGSRETTVGPGTGGFQLQYHVLGTEDDLEVHTAIQGVLTLVARGFVFLSYTIKHLGGGVWEANASYGPRPFRGGIPTLGGGGDDPTKLGPANANGWTFDTSGGTAHITNSLTNIGRHGRVITVLGHDYEFKPPDVKGAIGWTPDSVEGVDIVVPSFQFTETHYLSVAAIDAAYIRNLFELTGTMNFSTFRGFSQGECLFLGASGAQRDQMVAELTFRFGCEPNKTNFLVGDILVPEKLGHDYLSVRYEDEVVTQTLTEEGVGGTTTDVKHRVKLPTGVYIERVYNFGDFSLLGIGT